MRYIFANIARAFPGLFRYADMVALDVREVFAWYRLAVQSLVVGANVGAIISGIAMADSGARERLIEKVSEMAVLSPIDEQRTSATLEAKELSPEEYRQKMNELRRLFGGAGVVANG